MRKPNDMHYIEHKRKVLRRVLQTICAPRPCILLQLLQMRCTFNAHNHKMFCVIFTNLLPTNPHTSQHLKTLWGSGGGGGSIASTWLKAVNKSNVLEIEAPDKFANAAPDDSLSTVEYILGMLIATVGNNTSSIHQISTEDMLILSTPIEGPNGAGRRKP